MNPSYSTACRRDVDKLLKGGGSLTSYRANPTIGSGPREGSWAWALERSLEKRFGVKHAVVTNSGTAALHCAVSTLFRDVHEENEIITSPLTFAATAASIVRAGFIPRFVDVDPKTFCITPETVAPAINRYTRAILPVHLFGNVTPVAPLQKFGLPVIEDAAQAVGCMDKSTKGGYAGTLGWAGVYSFGSNKQVPAGEGGALVTDSITVAHQARLLVNHAECFGAPYVGYNYRPSEVTCCIAWHSLQKLKRNTPFKRPYLVKRRGPNDKPYIEQTIDKLPAFEKYAMGRLPVAWDLAENRLCVH